MNKSLEYYLASISDHRRAQGLRIELVPLLTMVILANMGGSYGYREMARYMKDNENQFKKMFKLKHGVIKHVALRTFMQSLDFEAFKVAFRSWANQYVKPERGEILSIDGKGLNSTVKNSHDSLQNYKSMVSLFCEKTGLVKDIEMIESKKSNEIGAAQLLIERLESEGLLITADALHCQKKQ